MILRSSIRDAGKQSPSGGFPSSNTADRSRDNYVTGLASALSLEAEVARLERSIAEWIEACSPEMHEPLKWQFSGTPKYFRPLTVLSCFRASCDGDIEDEERISALVIELVHNMTLIVDDILDKSRYRRGKLTLHCRFGTLPALMTSGFIVSEAYRLVRSKPHVIALLSELLSRLGVAECLQWRIRSQPLGVEDWRQIAIEDTGSMFEVCACLGSSDERLRRFGQLLGVLYHGCDDVADVRGVEALGGGGDDDIRDGILTLPASIAIRNPAVSALFCNPTERGREELAAAFHAALPEAEHWLDRIAAEARREAHENAKRPAGLLTLVEYTRGLSRR
jgi:geranylgeranyl pyrophosphate synthase